MSDDEKFQMSAWRARLQSVNDETREYVPFFNTCAHELTLARSTKSPFLEAAKERFVSAQQLVKQSEKRYADLCSEIYRKWIVSMPTVDEIETDSDSESQGSTQSVILKAVPITFISTSGHDWRKPDQDNPLRMQVINKIYIWSKLHNNSMLVLSDNALLEGARKAEAILYSKAQSRREYEEEAMMMARLCEK
jgi:hypothetical protein